MTRDIVVLSELQKRYARSSEPAVNGVSLAVRESSFFGLLGPNGAGKTTLLSMVCGLLAPTAGSIVIAGHDAQREARQTRRLLGLVPQDLALYETLSAGENLAFFGSMQGLKAARLRERVGACLEATGLVDHATRRVAHFSGGLKRRLNLAVGLLHEPRILVLDEPTVGVDPQSRNHVFEVLKELHRGGMTVLYTTHYMEEAEELCEDIAILDHGRVIARGSPDDLLGQHPGTEVELQLEAAPDADSVSALETLEGVRAVQVEGRRVTLETGSPQEVLGRALDLLRPRDLPVRAVRSGDSSLEDVFLRLTGKSLRD